MNAIINDHKAIRKATFAFPEDRPQSVEVAVKPVETWARNAAAPDVAGGADYAWSGYVGGPASLANHHG